MKLQNCALMLTRTSLKRPRLWAQIYWQAYYYS